MRLLLAGLAALTATISLANAESAQPLLCLRDGSKPQPREKIEAPCLTQLAGLVERKGGVLRLKLQNGQFKTFTDVTVGCDAEKFDFSKCFSFQLVGYRHAQQAFIIDVSYYEGGVVKLVSSRTGNEVATATVPHYSPNGTRLISVDQNEMGDRKYDIAIMSSDGDPVRPEWEYRTPQGDRYEVWTFLSWVGDDRIRLSATVFDGKGKAQDHETVAIRTGQGWQLDRPWAKAAR